MSERLKGIQHLLSLKERAELEAFNKLSKTRTTYQQVLAKKKQLVDFGSEYHHQMEAFGKSGAKMNLLKNRIGFIEQLEKAQHQLDAQINQLKEALLVYEKKWLKAKMDYDAVEKLMQRISIEENERLLALEQKENDEYAQKIWHKKNKEQD